MRWFVYYWLDYDELFELPEKVSSYWLQINNARYIGESTLGNETYGM